MSGISSGVGLVSGLPIQDLVDSLVQAQRGPITQLRNRLGTLTSRRTALLQISAQILSLRNSATKFYNADFFNTAAVASSNESSILATADGSALPGQYTFHVRALATAHQMLTTGFATANATPVGAGTLTIESADGLLNRSTSLSALHGGAGVQLGKIAVTDRAGNQAQIDILSSQTIDDVVKAINADARINVVARTDGDRLVIADTSGGAGNLIVAEVGSGRTASELGILKTAAVGDLVGDNLVAISQSTLLSHLNDGNGVGTMATGEDDFQVSLADGSSLAFNLSEKLRPNMPLGLLNGGAGVAGGTIRITDRQGDIADIDLSGASTVQDVVDAINNAAGVDVTASTSGTSFVVTDTSLGDNEDAEHDLTVEDLSGSAAEQLGLARSTIGDKITGDAVYSVRSVGDVLRIVNLHPDNAGRLDASISSNGLGITLTDQTAGAGVFAVTALADGSGTVSKAAEDLGLLSPAAGNAIVSRRLVAGLNTVFLASLNGGAGIDLGGLTIQDRSGAGAAVDLSGVTTLADLIAAVNAAPTAITASVSASGLGLELTDSSGGAGNLTVSGLTADSLNIAIADATNSVSSGNLQKQYISEAMRLEDFGNGKGVPKGKFRITDSAGTSAVVDLTQGDETTLRHVIAEINSRPTQITARINDTGDGLILEDTAGGSQALKVEEEGGVVAKTLGILGEAAEGQTFIDGSLEKRIQIDGNDSLNDVLAKIKSSGAEVSASIINDGSGSRPHRLSLTSTRTGREGELAIDGGATGLAFDKLAEARDATVVFGSLDAAAPLVLSSSSNVLSDVIQGVRLDLVSAAESPVTITVRRDAESIVNDVRKFVSDFNTVMGTLDNLTGYDAETERRGILQSDSTARRIRRVLINLTGETVSGLPNDMNRLASVGITLGSGAAMKLDETRFRAALDNDPDGVARLFSLEEKNSQGEVVRQGLGGVIRAEIDRLTNSETGSIPLQEQALQTSEDQLNARISQLELLLAKRRERMVAQFNAMESVIAQLQGQQSALSALSNLGA